ncbi:MAG TPA: HoxN/HupN/NixA family nickel/cobalt transporter [Stellaceae bacterium]|nr:HoxN/HupN/NixA family nickel/cobalt transporter [Stellaceae bacterium]
MLGEGKLRRRVVGIYAILIGANLGAWTWALLAFRGYPVLLGTALLAYSFGARHAVDADHIAAIDNVTRKLMQQGQRPVGVGFFFSLGHSTVVALASAGIALAAAALQTRFADWREVGGLVGTGVSAGFLFLIALLNLVVLLQLYRTFRQVRRGGRYVEEELDLFLSQRGFLGRIFRPLFRLIGASWQMYPLGFLFGLGFDTATEIGLLGISAAEAAHGLSLWSILVFPALFTAGMSLIDTTDGVLMLGAYGWAFMKPMRKLYYNLTITFVSVLAALVVGGVEALGLVADHLNPEGGFWRAIAALNRNFGSLGFLIIALFIASWLVSMLVYRLKRYDEIEVTRG